MAEQLSFKTGSPEMLLAVDIGNTTVSLGCVVKASGEYEVLIKDRFPTADGSRAAVIKKTLERLMRGAKERLSADSDAGTASGETHTCEPGDIRITGIVISSVVPAVTEAVKAETLSFFKEKAVEKTERAVNEPAEIPVVEITTKSLTGLIFRSIDMSTLGHDRIVDAAWAAAHVKLPAVTVDMGTATTFNVIDEGGIFLGGMISAGIRTGMWGLNQRTAALPIPKERQPNGLIGKKTVDCLLSGAYNGSAAMIDGLVSRVEEELGKPATLVMTGGHAITVKDLCRHEVVYEPNLLMKGLALLFEKNRPAR